MTEENFADMVIIMGLVLFALPFVIWGEVDNYKARKRAEESKED